MVRRHSLPPHALKRQNSRFKIGAGVAAAAGAGAALLAVGLYDNANAMPMPMTNSLPLVSLALTKYLSFKLAQANYVAGSPVPSV